jgi:hypothetical protein
MDHHSLLSSLLGAVGDFFAFRTFIAPGVLYITYYLGAVAIPVFAWLFARQARTRALEVRARAQELTARAQAVAGQATRGKAAAPAHWVGDTGLGLADWARVAGVALATFILMEIGWRMLFEFLLAYFQMREALVGGAG